jgi:arylsulfatase A-like enzyme
MSATLSRREWMAGAAALSAAAQTRRSSAAKPNVLLILADDLGCHDLGCWGAADLRTPHIDSLAADGTRFTNWYSAAPVCAPARASLFSGRYPIRCGVPNNGPDLPASEKTIAAQLKPQGYATGLFGKWHLGSTPATCPNAHGFDRFFGFHSGCIDFYSHRYYWGEPRTVNYHDLWRDRTEVFEDGQYATELFTREAVQFIRDHRADPFLCCVTYNAVHYPMHAPHRYMERFSDLAPERRTYAAMLAALDDGVGQMVSALRESGQLDNTLIVFSADNGATREARAGLGGKPATAGINQPFRGNKFSAFDGGMHVPMIMRWPGAVPRGQVSTRVGSHLDLCPTIAAAAGALLPQDRTYDGANALDPAYTGHEAIYWSINGQLAVRRGPWKLVKDGKTYDGTPEGDKSLTGDDALFLSNLEDDPGERVNLRHRHPDVTDSLLTQAQNWLESVKTK